MDTNDPRPGESGWDPESALEAAAMERDTLELSMIDQGKKILEENLVPAACSIAFLAQHSANERIRLDASKYIIDRNLGRISDRDIKAADEADPFETFLADCVVEQQAKDVIKVGPPAPPNTATPERIDPSQGEIGPADDLD